MKLDEERLQQQREYDERRRQEALQKQQEDDARRQELARRKAEEEKRLAISTGTGFFVAPNGYLVTNNHVIDDTTDYAVRDFKGRFYRTQLIARDPKHDLALLKVAGNFPSLRIAHSDTVSKGQRVFAVGYPQIAIQGNESKVTDGIISSFSGIRNDDDWFQISVPIQGGNSGGPLVTESGSVVGVVVASVNVSRFYAKAGTLPQNVNYAIKSKLVLDFLKAQGMKNTPSVPAKAGLEAVDSATAMVIAKNGPIDVAYAVSPEQAALDERERVRQAAEVAKRRQAEEMRLAAETAEEAKRARMISAESKRLEKALAAETAKGEMEAKKAEAERRAHEARIAKRDAAVQKEIPDWPEMKQSNLFNAWILEQPDMSFDGFASAKSVDAIQVIRRYQSERERFAGILLDREKAKNAATEAEAKAVAERLQKQNEAASRIYVGKIVEVNKQYGFVVAHVNRQVLSGERLALELNGKEILLRSEKQIGGNLSLTMERANVSDSLIGGMIYVRR
jgi:co-chaperonin GroES (HSP10)